MTSGIDHICSVVRGMIAGLTPLVLPQFPFTAAPEQRPLQEDGVFDGEVIRTFAVWPGTDVRTRPGTWNGCFVDVTQTVFVELRYAIARLTPDFPTAYTLSGSDAGQIYHALVSDLRYPSAPSVTGVEHVGAARLTMHGNQNGVAHLEFSISHSLGGTDP